MKKKMTKKKIKSELNSWQTKVDVRMLHCNDVGVTLSISDNYFEGKYQHTDTEVSVYGLMPFEIYTDDNTDRAVILQALQKLKEQQKILSKAIKSLKEYV